MGFTPRGRGGFRGGRGGGRFDNANQGPPEEVVEVGTYHHSCQEDIVCKLTNEKIPHFNAFVYLENKEEVGKVDEIFGPIKDAYFSVKLNDSIKSKSFKEGLKFYMDPYKFLPLDRVLNPNAFRGKYNCIDLVPGALLCIDSSLSATTGRLVRRSRGGRGSDNRGNGRGGRGDFRGKPCSSQERLSWYGRWMATIAGSAARTLATLPDGRGGESRGGRGGDFRGGRGGGRGDFRGGRDSGRGDYQVAVEAEEIIVGDVVSMAANELRIISRSVRRIRERKYVSTLRSKPIFSLYCPCTDSFNRTL
ncbi:H/ACA ribonucleoprotein complex subunit [Fasciola gigantica]|uniref:H/ACA ribonucleoprotein complex subunit n=1 Tax=Fasciola gigantica TaxID=46835 RepID=A0A504YTK9_FASGI|nr:H/ACA ribonucleoprotein complex subunit [Fasciola gigantica]